MTQSIPVAVPRLKKTAPLIKLNSTDYVLLAFLVIGVILTTSATLMFDLPRPVAGVAYLGLYLALSFRYPALALALTLAVAPFQQSLTGSEEGKGIQIALAEFNVFLTLPALLLACLLRRSPPKFGPLLLPIGFFFAVCLYSSAMSWRATSALSSLLQMFLYMVITVVVFSSFLKKPEQLKIGLQGLVGVCVVLSVLLIALRTNYVFGLHKNGIGSSLACGLLVNAELWFSETDKKRRTRHILTLVIISLGLVATLSRGSWLSALVGLILIIGLRREYKIMLNLLLLLIPLITVAFVLMPEEDKDYAFDIANTKRWNVQQRVLNSEYARSQFNKNPLTGVGVGLRKEYDATNILWTTLAETGVIGLSAFLLVHLAFLSMVITASRHLPKTDPAFALLPIGAALLFSRLTHGMVDHYWSRGALMLGWAGAGMSVRTYYLAQQYKKKKRGTA